LLSKSYVKDYRKNIEVVSFKEKFSKIRGLVTVELFDAATKKKVLEAKTENLITSIGYNFLRWAIQDRIIQNSSASKPSFSNVFNQIQLYSSSQIESDDLYPETGNLIGWADQTAYAGSDTLRGSLNVTESNFNFNRYMRMHFVFDWPTSAANGTFQTIIWAYSNPLQFAWYSFSSPDSAPYGLAWDGTNLWLAGYNTQKIYKLNPSTGAVISSFSSPDSWPYGLAWDGTNLWLAGRSTQKIYKLNPSTGAVISSFSSPDSWPYGLAWDGTNLWLAGGNQQKIYKINPSTGAIISSFSSPDSSPRGLAWDGTNLWLAGANTQKIYKLNPSTGAVISSFSSPDSWPYGLAWDGTNLWLAGANTQKIYKLNQALYGARTLLASPVTKTSTNTMKIQYDFVFQE
jgi:outer membrane protein assembly factor BamB